MFCEHLPGVGTVAKTLTATLEAAAIFPVALAGQAAPVLAEPAPSTARTNA
jgi:hypothetical protein